MISLDQVSSQLLFLIKASLKGEVETTGSGKSGESVDWGKLVELSHWHQVTCLLYDHLSSTDNKQISTGVLEKLKEQGTSQAVFNMIFLKKSNELNAALSTEGVEAFLMKGALWAWMLYENPGLREFGDIDFFLKKEQIHEGLAVMAKYGFEPDNYRKYLLENDKVAKLYFNTDYQLPLTPVTTNMLQSLEVQWNTTYPRYHYSFSWEELSEQRISFEIAGSSLSVPRIENQLLMMIIHHAGVEQWDKLKFVADLVRLLRKYGQQLDWNYVILKTKQKGFYKLLLESLGLIYFLSGENFLRFCGENLEKKYPSQKFLEKVLTHWENKREKPVTKSWQIFYFNMIYRDRLSDKLAILFSHLAYLLEWRLIIPKARWYRRLPKPTSN
ncbi:nucleotidyltransferase family protein [Dyadobacter subterraneus]|uniref:Nucleotidyltransferase family protein n=1 Tax=Dyadobacter subterraneus TaxID=2773304 RepID=A0ABR9W6R1_9BACT|nr:nucleotidyltransferase family protein [Dyadobacter subterraneus]MBE9461157.1 nucleotidyltransferase family protein [Dyadobacter subterraneus]